MNLYTRLVLALIISLSAAMGLVNYIQFGKYQRTYSDVFQSRFGVVSREVVNTLERGLALGLPLRDLEQNLQTIVARYRQRDPDIVAIVVTDERGQPIVQDGQQEGRMGADRQTVTGNAGDLVGEVAVYYRIEALEDSLAQVWRQLTVAGGLSVGLGAVIAMLLMRMLLSGVLRDLDRMGQQLEAVSQGQRPSRSQAQGQPSPLEIELRRYLLTIWQQQQNRDIPIHSRPYDSGFSYITGTLSNRAKKPNP